MVDPGLVGYSSNPAVLVNADAACHCSWLRQRFLAVAEFARIQIVLSGPNSGECGCGVNCQDQLPRSCLTQKSSNDATLTNFHVCRGRDDLFPRADRRR
jgi:hypothetical protein